MKLAAPIAALRLADVGAEARAVAREAGRAVADGGRVLALAPDGSTSERIAAALRRNGVPVADDGSVPLSRHALVSAVRPLLPVFLSGGEAPVDGSDLLRLLTDPVLSRSAPAGSPPSPTSATCGRSSFACPRRSSEGSSRLLQTPSSPSTRSSASSSTTRVPRRSSVGAGRKPWAGGSTFSSPSASGDFTRSTFVASPQGQ